MAFRPLLSHWAPRPVPTLARTRPGSPVGFLSRIAAVLVALALGAPAASAQPDVHPADREVGRLGVSFAPGRAGGLSTFTPSLVGTTDCYHDDGYDAYYGCGSAVAAFLTDGEFEYDLFSSHTLFFSPASVIDPYLTAYAGVGYGEEAGLVYGAETGVNVWIVPNGGVSVYLGRVVGERQRYTRLGAGLVVSLYP